MLAPDLRRASGPVLTMFRKKDKKAAKENVGPSKQEKAPTASVEDGGEYEGDYDDEGKRNGSGTMRFRSGEVYEGQWVGGQCEGEGQFTYSNGNVYSGQWVANRKQGKGKLCYARSGCVYEGDWVDDKKDGRGTYTFANGSQYEGEWVENVQEGKGQMRFPNGCVYEGDFIGGAREGRGTYSWPSGASPDAPHSRAALPTAADSAIEPSPAPCPTAGFAEVGRFKNGKGVGEGVRWNPDRTYPHKLVDGRVVGSFPAPGETTIAISQEEAERIAADLGVPVPAPARVPD